MTRDEKMNALALRISRFIEGEDLLDVALVCTRIIAVAVNESYYSDEEKIKSLDHLIEFMKKDMSHLMKELVDGHELH